MVGGVTEFKMEGMSKSQQYGQTFADMVRVRTFLANDVLMRGILVQKLVVYGLLINYKTALAVIMKYFNKDS